MLGLVVGTIGLIVAVSCLSMNINTNRKLDRYDMTKVDPHKIALDEIHGVSLQERRRRCVNGYYDKDKTSE